MANSTSDLDDPPAGTTQNFRLIQAARTITTGSSTTTQSDAATDAGGAFVSIDWPANPDTQSPTIRFTIGNAALGIANVTLGPPQPSGAREVTLADGRVVSLTLQTTDRTSAGTADDFLWTAYGAWNVRSAANVPQNSSAIVGGYETADSAIPTTGSAVFNGFVTGSVAVPDGTGIKGAALQGDASLTANFATGTVSGSAPSIIAISPGNPSQPWNSLTFAGTFTTGLNGFTGTTGVSSAPGNAFSLLATATGFLAGRFFGPNAEEVGAVWNLYDGTGIANGVLVGKK
ncbi:MAG: transferrin-binding protein-like solute binding protein [Novosphingobium sp.]|nr:transferrin-binding protein-like solute binding protein [Novosphingobium sp.]